MTYIRMTLVITTINVPRLLEDYARNLERFGHLPDTSALIIGDRKTPHGAVADLAANLRMRGFDARYVGLEEQDRFLDRFPRLKPLIPFNSDNRRNIGYLMAKEWGAEIIVAVDDDNFVGADDWYEGHSLVGSTLKVKSVSCANGWFNPCRMMDMDPPIPTFARGYPYAQRHIANEETFSVSEGRVVLQRGIVARRSRRGLADTADDAGAGSPPEGGPPHARPRDLGADQHAEYRLPPGPSARVLLRAGR